jgi:hypothetical protein
MKENINIEVDEIKSMCKKCEIDFDHVWNEISELVSFAKMFVHCKRQKRNGVPVVTLLQIALALPLFLSNSVKSFFRSRFQRMFSLDCSTSFYRFFQDENINWRSVLYGLNKQVAMHDHGDDASLPTALIFDDSPIPKTGKKIEGITRVFNHVTHRHILGFNLLGMCWFNGAYSRFLDFSLVGEKSLKGKEKRKQFSKRRESKSFGFKRKQELKKTKIKLVVEMLKRAVKQQFIPEYVLCDSWYTCAEIINKTRSLANGTIHYLGMVKDSRRLYTYEGKTYTLSQLRRHVFSLKKRCTKFNSSYIEVTCEVPSIGTVKIFFSRYFRNKKWVALLTTDLSLKYIAAMKLYAIRWNIEMNFKECKQLLKLGKHSANDFDSQIAHTTNVLMVHALLVTLKFVHDHKSLGVLFEDINDQYTELLAIEKIIAMLEFFLSSLAEQMGGSNVVTLDELLHSQAYRTFKQMIENSLLLKSDFAFSVYSTNNKDDAETDVAPAA